MSSNSIQCVIFDCDGVLIDSEPISARILIEQLASIGVEVDSHYVQQNFLGRSWVKIVDEMRVQHGLTLGADFESGYRDKLLAAFETDLTSVNGVEAIIDSLRVTTCVATSSSPRRVARSLEITGLGKRFGDRVFTASEVENGKPAPDLFLHAAATLGFDPKNCLVIEDSIPGVQAAKAAGMQVVRFMGGTHLLGQIETSRKTLADVTHFDKWNNFYSIAPTLRNPSR